MKILITGKSGYIGKALASALNKDHDITAIGRDDFDLTNYSKVCDWFSDKFFDVVLHTAIVGGSRLIEETSDVLDQNIMMYYNLLNNKKHFGKFINFGSGAELHDTMYGISKNTIFNSLKDKKDFYNIRIYGLFDHNEKESRFIKSNIFRYKEKQSIIIFKNKQMDFFFMEDLISVIRYFLYNNNPPTVFDCTYEKSLTLYNIAEIINNLNDYKVDIEIWDQTIQDNYVGEFSKLPIDYIGLEKGIQKTYKLLFDKCKA